VDSKFHEHAHEYETGGNGNGAAHDEGFEWGEPEIIKEELLPVEPLPPSFIPEPFREWIMDISHRMQCPPDFVAMAAIVLVGSIIGTRCGIRPKKLDDWLVIANLWGGAVGRPSMLKTPSLEQALRPLARLEAEAKEAFDEAMKQYELDLMELTAKKEALKADMKKAAQGKGGKTMENIKKEFSSLEDPGKPTMRRYKSNDATIEKLSELLNENPAGLLIFRDELIGLLASWEKAGRESDRAFFLELWNGTGSHISDRIGRGTVFTEFACASLFGGIQPGKLIGYLYLAMKGLENDGLLQRLQLMVYPDEVKNWQNIDQSPDRQARERAFKVIERLTTMDFKDYGASKEESDKFPYLRFSDEAQELFYEWLTELQLTKLQADDHPLIIEHLGKFRSLMPSLALISHMVAVADGATPGPVSLEAATQAAAGCEYLESHARRIYGLVADVNHHSAGKLAEKIKDEKLEDGFTVRDIYNKNWHMLNDRELAQAACDYLVEAEWLRQKVTPPSFGQKGKITFLINPKCLAV